MRMGEVFFLTFIEPAEKCTSKSPAFKNRRLGHPQLQNHSNPGPSDHIPRTASAPGLNTKLTQMMVQMLVHQCRPFQRSQRTEKEVLMFCAYARTACCKAVYRFAEPFPLGHEFP